MLQRLNGGQLVVAPSNSFTRIQSLIVSQAQSIANQLHLDMATTDRNQLIRNEATVIHKVTQWAKNAEDDAGNTFKYTLWLSFKHDVWMFAREDVLNLHNEVVGTRGFTSYKDWFDFQTVGRSAAGKSQLWNGITHFLKAVDEGRVTKNDGVAWTVEEVVAMPDRNFAAMASLTRRFEKENRVADLNQYIDTALNETLEVLMGDLQDAGDAGRRRPEIHAYVVYHEDGSSDIYMTLTEEQLTALDRTMKGSLIRHSISGQDLLQRVRTEIGDDNPNFDDIFNNYAPEQPTGVEVGS